MILTKMETFLKVFEKIDVKVVLVPTNISKGQLNIKDYEYDNGGVINMLPLEKFRDILNSVLFEHWLDKLVNWLSHP